MNKEQQQIIDEAYKVFYENALSIKKGYEDGDMLGSQPHIDEMFSNPDELIILTKEEFINKCKTDISFSVKWELKIEKRELTWSERFNLALFNPTYKSLELRKTLEAESYMLHYPDGHKKVMDEANFPTKLITITYNNKTIESYE